MFLESCLTLGDPMDRAPLSMEFSRQKYWSGLPCSLPGDLSNPGIKSCLLHWQADSLPLSHLGSPNNGRELANSVCSEARPA